jgi:hypothetical protein
MGGEAPPNNTPKLFQHVLVFGVVRVVRRLAQPHTRTNNSIGTVNALEALHQVRQNTAEHVTNVTKRAGLWNPLLASHAQPSTHKCRNFPDDVDIFLTDAMVLAAAVTSNSNSPRTCRFTPANCREARSDFVNAFCMSTVKGLILKIRSNSDFRVTRCTDTTPQHAVTSSGWTPSSRREHETGRTENLDCPIP